MERVNSIVELDIQMMVLKSNFCELLIEHGFGVINIHDHDNQRLLLESPIASDFKALVAEMIPLEMKSTELAINYIRENPQDIQ